MASHQDPAPDFKKSPYTGWTRAHWEHMLARATYGYVLAGERNGSPARALFPDDRCDRPDAVDASEAFSRIALPWGTWLCNAANPSTLAFADREIDLADLMRRALIQGTDPTNPYTYWGDIGHLDQRIVETSNLALAVWFSRERVFYFLTDRERAQVMRWLAQVDGKETYPDNWVLFPAFSQIVRLKLGYDAPEDDLDARLDQMSRFYRGDGWYDDGAGDKFDLYNAWMFGLHYLLWAWIDGDRRPEHKREVLARAKIFLASFPFFFGANGSYVAWGRTLVGRFAAVATFAIGHALGIAPRNPGMLRRISSGCLKYFYERGAFDPTEHFLRQGFHGNFPPAGESYLSSGSPLSACHGLFALTLDHDDPFWTAVEEPLPVEQQDFERVLLVPGFLVSGRRETGQTLLLNSRAGHESDTPRNDYVSKYGKFAYSSHLPFNVVPVAGSYAPDAMIALTHDGRTFGHRQATRAGGVGPGMMWCEFDEIVDGQPHTLRVAVLLWKDLQILLALVEPNALVRAVQAPGALGCSGAARVLRRSDRSAGWEYACAHEVASGEQRAVGIRRLLGYDAQEASRPFLGYSNLNLAHDYAEQPVIYESLLSDQRRMLGSLSLVRPAPFDPQQELAGVSLLRQENETVDVTFKDGGKAFVALGTRRPDRIQVGGFDVTGASIRYVRIGAGGNHIAGIGLTRIEGIARLTSPGTLWLERHENMVYLSADVGVSIERAWLEGVMGELQVRAPDATWVNVGADAADGISQELVTEWSQRTMLQFVEFRFRTAEDQGPQKVG